MKKVITKRPRLNSVAKDKNSGSITEKKLGIPPDYQYKATRSKNFIQANWHKNKVYVINRLFKFNKKMDILDLGTGSGNFELFFSKHVRKIVGIDYNHEAINFLKNRLHRKNIKNVCLLAKDIRKLHEIKGLGRFDLIFLIDTIEHLQISDIEKVISKLKKFLKNRGKVCIITPNYKSLWPLIEFLFDKLNLVPKLSGEQHLTRLNKSTVLKIFKEGGFKIEKITSFNLFSFLSPSDKLSEALVSFELRIPIAIGNLLVGIFSYEHKSKPKQLPS